MILAVVCYWTDKIFMASACALVPFAHLHGVLGMWPFDTSGYAFTSFDLMRKSFLARIGAIFNSLHRSISVMMEGWVFDLSVIAIPLYG